VTRVFFDDYPLFCDTSQTAASKRRLNLRHQAIIDANRDILQGARVLDLASHDGRWSFAALKAGAAHVTGVEARQSLVENAHRTFDHYQVPPDRYNIIHGDVFQVLGGELDVDVVLCLGFMYHTLRYAELLHGILASEAQACILDTKVTVSTEPVVWLKVNHTDVEANAADDALSYKQQAMAGWPSVPALELMLNMYDMHVEKQYDWPALLAQHRARLAGYQTGERVTLRCGIRRQAPTGANSNAHDGDHKPVTANGG
jgi:Methyltransferase domain